MLGDEAGNGKRIMSLLLRTPRWLVSHDSDRPLTHGPDPQ